MFPFTIKKSWGTATLAMYSTKKTNIMQTANEKLIAFLEQNPHASKAQITEATGLKGLPLFNTVKYLLKDCTITSHGEGDDMTYAIAENKSGEAVIENITKGSKAKKTTPALAPAATSTSRDTAKYKFNGEEYGKGPLVRAVVEKYVEDTPDITFKQLKEIFPDTLMKRFGVFANEQDAKNLSGKKNRYFLKPEQLIKIKGQKAPIAVCNQWTAELIRPFLIVVKELGYKVK